MRAGGEPRVLVPLSAEARSGQVRFPGAGLLGRGGGLGVENV